MNVTTCVRLATGVGASWVRPSLRPEDGTPDEEDDGNGRREGQPAELEPPAGA